MSGAYFGKYDQKVRVIADFIDNRTNVNKARYQAKADYKNYREKLVKSGYQLISTGKIELYINAPPGLEGKTW